MKIRTVKIKGSNQHIKYWYDFNVRSWVVGLFDEAGNQVGDCTFVYSKREALAAVDYEVLNNYNARMCR